MSNLVLARQRALFELIAEFFERATGDSVRTFAARGRFDATIRARASLLAAKGKEAFPWFEKLYRDFYAREQTSAFADARSLGGMKLVLGGSARFSSSQLASVRKMLLYADTVLIPDPMLPWFEDERSEERFRHVLLLQTAYWLLHLRPLVNADLPYPAILVFPSWERSLELHDETTRSRQEALIVDTLGYHIGRRVLSLDELVTYATESEAEFLNSVDRAKLLLAPGAESPEPLKESIERYRAEVRKWRSQEHVRILESLPPGQFVLNALMERLGPLYHMLENSEELNAHPMMCLDAHWYYFEQIAEARQGELSEAGFLTPNAAATLRAINKPTLEWLGNVPIDALVELRLDNANEEFRRQLEGHTSQLRAASLANLDAVASEVGHGLSALMSAHQIDLRRICEDYRLRHIKTLAIGATTAAAMFVPALAPFVGNLAAPAAVAGKYLYDKAQERLDRSREARSLTGVLAKAKLATGQQ